VRQRPIGPAVDDAVGRLGDADEAGRHHRVRGQRTTGRVHFSRPAQAELADEDRLLAGRRAVEFRQVEGVDRQARRGNRHRCGEFRRRCPGEVARAERVGVDAVVDAPDGASFRLERDTLHGWMLLRDGHPGTTDGRGTGEGFQPQYSFALGQVWDADLHLSNHWTSTAPESRFLQLRLVSIVLPRGLAGLTDRIYRRRAGEEETVAEIVDPRVYRMRLSLMFGIDFSAEEVAALGLFGEA